MSNAKARQVLILAEPLPRVRIQESRLLSAPGSYTFGANRIAATLSRTALRVICGGETSAIILRCRSVPSDHSALLCSPNAYELEIE